MKPSRSRSAAIRGSCAARSPGSESSIGLPTKSPTSPPCICAKAGLTATTLRLRGSMTAIPRVVRSKLSSHSVRSSDGSISGA